jgi:hypothetical protein
MHFKMLTIAAVGGVLSFSGEYADALFLALLLGCSAGVIASCLWLSEGLKLDERVDAVYQRPSETRSRGLRSALGLVALGGSIAYLVGAVPGTQPLSAWTASAAAGSAFLGLLAIVSAQQAPKNASARSEQPDVRQHPAHTARKAA